jgi:predicted amidohydrolase
MERRQFVKGAAAAIGAIAYGAHTTPIVAQESAPVDAAPAKANRLVRAVSISYDWHVPALPQLADRVDREAAKGSDIIILPEHCQGFDEHGTQKTIETLDGPTITAMAKIARKHRTYIVCPIDRREGDLRFNSAVLLDRRGQVVCTYDKAYPVYHQECLSKPPVQPGDFVRVYPADFGRIGFAICFDVNWTSLWHKLWNLRADLVVFPSWFSGGRILQAQAIQYNYYVMSSTRIPDCQVYDIDGELLVHDHENAGKGFNVTRTELDMDRCIFHQDGNMPGKLDKLLQAHGNDVERQKWLPMEGWFVLRAKRPSVSAKELAKQYGLESLHHYINRSQCEIDQCRGWEFS